MKKLLLLCIILLIIVIGVSPTFGLSKTPRCANSLSCEALPILQVENDALGIFADQIIVPPTIDLASEIQISKVLGDETHSQEKHIYVDLEKQLLTAYDGETLFMDAQVSTGKWGRTPPGEYSIWVKMRSTRMAGGSGSDYYNLPNVPYVMYFYSPKVPKISGYSLHGAYWHNNFGHPMSHGCVNMRQIDAEKLYDWATPATISSITYVDTVNTGTKVTIF